MAWYGVVNTGTLNVRTWAGTENPQLKSYPTISQGTKVGVCDTIRDKDGDAWYYIQIKGDKGEKYGFVAAAYITKQSSSKPNADTTVSDDGVITKTPQWVGKVVADWFQLSKGDNIFAYVVEEGTTNVQFKIENRTAFEGV